MSHETVPTLRRIYLVFEAGAQGMVQLRASMTPPTISHNAMVVLLSRGSLATMEGLSVPLVSDPSIAKGDPGLVGASAYQIARAHGYGGTETQWLTTLKGDPGKDAAATLGTVTITQTATLALSAGVRLIPVTVPAAFGLKAGDPVALVPTAHVAGYLVGNAVATTPTQVTVAVTAPLLAIGAAFSIPCRLLRYN